jgi:hypothetical protein
MLVWLDTSMPKASKFKPKPKPKANPKSKPKQKGKAAPQTPGITASKTYWVALLGIMVVFVSVLGAVSALGVAQIAALDIAVVAAVALVGYIRVTPSTLSISKRATFIFAGASLIGFGIWAIIALYGNASGFLVSAMQALGEQLFAVTSLVSCLCLGAFAGELIGQNRGVQARLFPPKMD